MLLPTVGGEFIKNMNDHVDLNGHLKMFSLGDVSLFETYLGGKYYFKPQDIDGWRATLGLKSYSIEAKDGSNGFDLEHSGLHFALQRSF
jgi:hypothetical protein